MDDGIEIAEEEHVAMRSRRIEEKLIRFHRFDLPAEEEKKRNLRNRERERGLGCKKEKEKDGWMKLKTKKKKKGGLEDHDLMAEEASTPQ